MLAGVELALRARLGPPPAPVAVFSGLQARDHYVEVEQGGLRLDYQNRGGPRIPLQVGGPRIAVLGGSSVRGGSPGVGPEGEFPALLQRELGLEVLNLGNPGLDSHDHVRILDEIAALRLTALVLYAGHNDFGNTYFHQRYGGLSGGLGARARSLLERLQLYCSLRRWVAPPALDGRAPDPRNQFAGPGVGAAQRRAALAYLGQNLRRLAWTAAGRDLPLVLVVPVSAETRAPMGRCAPDEDPCAREVWTRAGATPDPAARLALYRQARDLDPIPLRAPTAAQALVREVAAEAGLPLVDPERDLPRAADLDVPDDALFADVVHLSRAGHAAMAALLARELAPLLPPPGGGRASPSRP